MGHALAVLPFAKERKDGTVDLWVVPETGDMEAAGELGASHADALVAYIHEIEFGAVLGHVVRAVHAKGRFGPVEDAFFQRLGDRLI